MKHLQFGEFFGYGLEVPFGPSGRTVREQAKAAYLLRCRVVAYDDRYFEVADRLIKLEEGQIVHAESLVAPSAVASAIP